MTFIINGEEVRSEAQTLSDLLSELDYQGDWLATAVNGELVATDDRSAFSLNDGARIEILSPMQGG